MSAGPERVFGQLCNGEIEIRLMTKKYVEGAVEVMKKSFFINENVCRATDIYLPESVDAKMELEGLVRGLIDDGISLVAIHIPTERVVAVAINTIMYIPENGEETFIEKFGRESVKTPNCKSIFVFLNKMDKEMDIFKQYNVDCIFEIMFLSTLPEFERKRIGMKLSEYTIQLAKEISRGEGRIYLRNDIKDKCPKVVSALFTSILSQKIGDRLGFEILKEVSYETLSYNGRTYAEKIDPQHRNCVVAGLKL